MRKCSLLLTMAYLLCGSFAFAEGGSELKWMYPQNQTESYGNAVGSDMAATQSLLTQIAEVMGVRLTFDLITIRYPGIRGYLYPSTHIVATVDKASNCAIPNNLELTLRHPIVGRANLVGLSGETEENEIIASLFASYICGGAKVTVGFPGGYGYSVNAAVIHFY